MYNSTFRQWSKQQSNQSIQNQDAASERNCAPKLRREKPLKKFVLGFIAVVLCAAAQAQNTPKAEAGRFFLPSDTFWGYAQFDIAPPHNEIDPNLCVATAGAYGGKDAPCN